MSIKDQWDKWIDGLGFDYWSCFTYHSHSMSLDRLARVIRTGKGYVPAEVRNDKIEITKKLEECRKAIDNALKTYAIKTKTHVLVYAGGELQPEGKRPHYHLAIKHLKPRIATLAAENLIFPWLARNPSPTHKPSAYLRPYQIGLQGPSYIESHKDSFLQVYCPKRSKRCKKNKCKGVRLFQEA